MAEQPSGKSNQCDEQCTCPEHRTPLLYWPFGDEHACAAANCKACPRDGSSPWQRLIDVARYEEGLLRYPGRAPGTLVQSWVPGVSLKHLATGLPHESPGHRKLRERLEHLTPGQPAEVDGKTVITFRLDPVIFGLLSNVQAQQMVGNRAPVTWGSHQAEGTVIAVSVKPGDFRITVELDGDPGFLNDIAERAAPAEGAAED